MACLGAMASPAEVRDVTRRVIERFTQNGFMFTALDVSNEVKQQLSGVRHRDVAPLVREMFDDDVMGDAYTRTLIDVMAGGSKKAEAFLYYDEEDDPEDYDGSLREQTAAPPSSSSSQGSSPAAAAPPVSSPADGNSAPTAPANDPSVLKLDIDDDEGIVIPKSFVEFAVIHDDKVFLDAAMIGSGLVIKPPDGSRPLAELDVTAQGVEVPASLLLAFDDEEPLILRAGVRIIEIEGTPR